MTEFGSLDALQLGQVASAPLLGAIVSSATIAVAGDKAVGAQTGAASGSAAFRGRHRTAEPDKLLYATDGGADSVRSWHRHGNACCAIIHRGDCP